VLYYRKDVVDSTRKCQIINFKKRKNQFGKTNFNLQYFQVRHIFPIELVTKAIAMATFLVYKVVIAIHVNLSYSCEFKLFM
jgi:hypothetical protein